MSKPKKDLPALTAVRQAGRQDKNIQIPNDTLRELLTPSEWRMLKNRYQIMNLLEEGLSIRKIAERIKVGTDTVVRVARMVEKYPKAKKIKSLTPWIFGKSE
ncbi:helix-turn-helix domain-containing protein [Candidatus Daviesbacteria bacterium]|nr:helix-turn-helix domain-containing protein [Candidatus Daviesbacteria bacterium]